MHRVTIVHNKPVPDEHEVMGALRELPGVLGVSFGRYVLVRVAMVDIDESLTEADVLAHLTGGVAPHASILRTDNIF